MDDKNDKPYSINDLEEALMDVVDGQTEHDLVSATGLTIERCKEICRIANLVFKEKGY
jgi:hypothetical protein